MTNNNVVNLITTAYTDVKANVVREQGIYCFQSTKIDSDLMLKDDQGRTVYVPLNRDYQPIGVTNEKFVDCSDYVDTHGMVFECDPFKMGDVWDIESNEFRLYVFDDTIPASRSEYAKHMRAIMVHAKPYNGKLH
jgi:hypothetical protein